LGFSWIPAKTPHQPGSTSFRRLAISRTSPIRPSCASVHLRLIGVTVASNFFFEIHIQENIKRDIQPSTMQLPKTAIKLPSSTLSVHGKPVLDRNETMKRYSWPSMSPTFPKEACTKPFSSDESHHIFGVSSDFMSLPSLDQSSMTFSSSSLGSSHSSRGRMHSSYGSIGLPSAYPLHRKDTSFSSVTVEEELEDFEIFEEEDRADRRRALESSFSSPSSRNPLNQRSSLASTPRTPPCSLKSGPKRIHHRRKTAEIGSADGLVGTSKTPRGHRRTRNRALGPKDFHETVLTELFEDVSLNEFRY